MKFRFSKLFLSLTEDLSNHFSLKSPKIIISFLHEIESMLEIKQLEDSAGKGGGLYTFTVVKLFYQKGIQNVSVQLYV